MADRAHRRWLACAIAVALGGVVYLNALHNPFIYDDYRSVVENAPITHLTDLRAIVWYDVTRPLVNLSYALDRGIWGPLPFGFHLDSLLWHLANVVLLFVVTLRAREDAQRLTASGGATVSAVTAAFVAASLYAVHPLMTEAVGYISARADVLCATFFLAAVLTARRWMTGGRFPWWAIAAGCWVAALFTKEVAIVLPVVLFLYDRLLLDQTAQDRRRRFVALHAPGLAVAVTAVLVRGGIFVFREHPGEIAIDWPAGLAQIGVIGRYLGLIVLPEGQSVFHDVARVTTAIDRELWLGAAAIALLGGLAFAVRRRQPLISLGILWFVLVLAPSSALAALGQGEAMAEHRAYLASAGVFLATGVAIASLAARLHDASALLRGLAAVAFVTVLLSLSARTVLRNMVWSDATTVWAEAADRSPRHWLPRTVLGESLEAQGRYEEAVAAYRTALQLDPQQELVYLKLASVLTVLQRSSEATEVLSQLRARNPKSPNLRIGEGIIAMMSRDIDRARTSFRQAIAENPREVMARQWLAVLEEDMAGDFAEALRLCAEIHQLVPGRVSTTECIRRNELRLYGRTSGR